MPFATDKVVKRDVDGRIGGPDALNPEQYVNYDQMSRASAYPVANGTELQDLLARHQPSPTSPLRVLRNDTNRPADFQTTSDGVFWAQEPLGPAPFTYLDSFTTGGHYSVSHHNAGYMKTSAGIVVLTGLVAGVASGQVIFTLPPGYRPSVRTLFAALMANPAIGRVDIETNGNVIATQSTTQWISLEGIMFPCAEEVTALGGWKSPALNTGWTDYVNTDASWGPLGYIQDRLGRVWMKGMARQTTPVSSLSADSLMFTIPGTTVGVQEHYAGIGGGNTYSSQDIRNTANGAGVYAKVGTNTGWVSAQRAAFVNALVRPLKDWVDWPGVVNGWQRYNATFPNAHAISFSDGIVFAGGLLSSGTIATGATGDGRLINPEYFPDVGKYYGANKARTGIMLYLTNSNNGVSRTDLRLDLTSTSPRVQHNALGSTAWWSYGGINYVLGG